MKNRQMEVREITSAGKTLLRVMLDILSEQSASEREIYHEADSDSVLPEERRHKAVNVPPAYFAP